MRIEVVNPRFQGTSDLFAFHLETFPESDYGECLWLLFTASV